MNNFIEKRVITDSLTSFCIATNCECSSVFPCKSVIQCEHPSQSVSSKSLGNSYFLSCAFLWPVSHIKRESFQDHFLSTRNLLDDYCTPLHWETCPTVNSLRAWDNSRNRFPVLSVYGVCSLNILLPLVFFSSNISPEGIPSILSFPIHKITAASSSHVRAF